MTATLIKYCCQYWSIYYTTVTSILIPNLSKRKNTSSPNSLIAMLWVELAKPGKEISCSLVLVGFSLGLRSKTRSQPSSYENLQGSPSFVSHQLKDFLSTFPRQIFTVSENGPRALCHCDCKSTSVNNTIALLYSTHYSTCIQLMSAYSPNATESH